MLSIGGKQMNDFSLDLLSYTKELRHYKDKIVSIYEGLSERAEKPDFHREVQPFVNEVDKVAEAWKPLAEDWIKREKPLYIHPSQINATFDNIQAIVVSCFQQGTKKKLFYETIKSIDYVLSSIEIQVTANKE